LASGLDEHLPDAHRPAIDWTVTAEIDPPAEQIDRAAFAARSLADELHRRLGQQGVTCLRIGIGAETEYGEERLRFWRHEGALSDAAVADRVRWQLDGWLNGSSAQRPSGGITRLVLIPDGVVAARGRQLGFWGGENESDQRAARAIARLQGQLGTEAVLVPEYRGGRHPGEQLELVPAAAVELSGRVLQQGEQPWPGALPAPSPSRVLATAIPVGVFDEHGGSVSISGRGLLSSPPAVIEMARQRLKVVAWAGPWPVDERWWDHDAHVRQARLQVVTSDGRAQLLVLMDQRWAMTAEWD
jgi:protein ImuB